MKKTSISLLIASIFLLVFVPVLILLTNSAMIIFGEIPGLPPVMDGLVTFGSLYIIVILIILSIAGGIVGIISWRNPCRTKPCQILGVIILVCNIIQLISYIVADVRGLAVFCWLLNSAIPAWYTAAAYEYRKLGGKNEEEPHVPLP